MEKSAESFEARILQRTGLSLSEIPDAHEDALMDGSMICGRGETAIVLVDYIVEDDDGCAMFARVVCVGRTEDFHLPREGASGFIPDGDEEEPWLQDARQAARQAARA